MYRIGIQLIALIFLIELAQAFIIPLIDQFLPLLNDIDITVNGVIKQPYNLIASSELINIISPVYILLTPLIGAYSDRIPRGKVTRYCLIMPIVGSILLLINIKFNIPVFFLFSLILLNITEIVADLSLAMLADNFRQKEQQLTIFFSMALAAYMIVMLFQQLSNSDTKISYFFQNQTYTTIGTLITCIIAFLFVRWVSSSQKKLKMQSLTTYPHLKDQMTRFFTNTHILILLIIIFLTQFCFGLYFQGIKNFLMSVEHYTDLQSSVFISYKLVWTIVCLFTIVPFLIKQLETKKLLRIGVSLNMLGLVCAAISHFMLLQWIALIPLALGEALLIPILCLELIKASGPDNHGLAMGCQGAVWSLGWGLSVILSSLTSNHALLALQLSVLFIFIALLIIWKISAVHLKSHPEVIEN